MRIFRKITAILAALVIASGMAVSGLAAEAAFGDADGHEPVDRPALIKSVTGYQYDFRTNGLAECYVTEYEYENAYPVSKTTVYTDDPENMPKTTFEYTFDKGVPVQMKQFDENGREFAAVTYTAEGRIDRLNTWSEDERNKLELIYIYGNDDDYFTFVFHEMENLMADLDGGVNDYSEEADQIEVTSKDGLLQKTVNNGIYANWGDNEAKKWERFNGTYTAEYDESGILKNTSAVYRTGPSGKEYRYTLTVENGRVLEALRDRWMSSGNDGRGGWETDAKFVFEYTDIPVSAARYASMINAHIMLEENTYYIYNWY